MNGQQTGQWPWTHLPEDADALIGRESELRELARLVPQAALVTLTGPPGRGKSRTAIAIARRPPVTVATMMRK